MFNKKITPFSCIIVSLFAVVVTFVAVFSATAVAYNTEIKSLREDLAYYAQYDSLIALLRDSNLTVDGENSVGSDDGKTDSGDDVTDEIVGETKVDKYTKLAEMMSFLDSKYIYEYDDEALWNNIYRTIAASIGDKYSQYFTAEEYNELLNSDDGDFVGIGVHATYDAETEGIYIFGVMSGSPAEKGGIESGDIIVAAEGTKATKDNYYGMLDIIRGQAGTDVNLTILRDDEEMEVTLTRAAVPSENVTYQEVEDGVAYIRIFSFSDTTLATQFAEKINLAQADGCDKFIFDVRNNTGGYLDEICKTLDLLLPEGPIINIVDKNGETTTKDSDANCITAEKMVVLCNESTASAAELFTAALRDYDLAEIVGTKTFGKGSMQTNYILSGGGAFKFSTAYYNPPSNVSYDGIGITPDHVVELDEEWQDKFYKMPLDEDAQFEKALELVTSTD